MLKDIYIILYVYEMYFLSWKVECGKRKSLITLSDEALFKIAKTVGPVPDKDQSKLVVEDEGCLEYINVFMMSKTLLESEDQGWFNC